MKWKQKNEKNEMKAKEMKKWNESSAGASKFPPTISRVTSYSFIL